MATNKEDKIYGVYIPSVLTKKMYLSITQVGSNLKQNLEEMLRNTCEGKCIAEGFIQPRSIKIITYSSGNVDNNYVSFETVFECMICHPVEGMVIECNVKTITKAGIHGEVIDEHGNIPMSIFVARDHHFTNKDFAKINEGDKVKASVIGCKFELNDPYISSIASLKN